jgi:hypothetical protein
MSPADSQNAGGSGTSVLAKEIAHELARLVRWTQPEADQADPKGLRDVQPALFNIEQTAKYLGRTVKGVRDLERKGILVPVRFDRKVQFRRRDLDEAIERHSA